MHHVDADYIKEMQAKGKTGLSLEEYKRMKVRSWENEE
jgi:hypothetical protein